MELNVDAFLASSTEGIKNTGITELVHKITLAQAKHVVMSPEEIDKFMQTVFNRIKQMRDEELRIKLGRQEIEEEKQKQIDPMSTIKKDTIICLECGGKFKTLSAAHLATHGLTHDEYREKWGFPKRFPLVSRSHLKKLSEYAKRQRLPGTRRFVSLH